MLIELHMIFVMSFCSGFFVQDFYRILTQEH